MANRLANATSPYLLQHAYNPVDWWPWSEEAFEEAQVTDRPVFVSIGYSACHWCHVMAHESFEDPATAELLNRRFVSIKVDREERPDVDSLYMDAVMAMTGRGGWPMTVFCTPKGRPFYGGTYFPKQAGHGMPSFVSVLEAVLDAWDNRRRQVVEQGEQLSFAIWQRSQVPEPSPGSPPAKSLIRSAYREFADTFDSRWGGFGTAPKFPQPSAIDFLLHLGSAPEVLGDQGQDAHVLGHEAVDMALRTLRAMECGGIRDHLGGGFARYSTDSRWLVPHFEKMAYDQSGIAVAMLHAWQLSGLEVFKEVAEETLRFLIQDLSGPEGEVHSALDADSEGEEGLYYLWTPEEFEEVLGPSLGPEAARWWGVAQGGNFEGRSILHRPWNGRVEEYERMPAPIASAREMLLERRASRVPPGRDDKVVTEWNAMAMSALAQASMATGDLAWLGAAKRIAEFLVANLRRSDGRWLRSWRMGRGSQPAFASDYAWLIDAFTRLGEASGELRWTEFAMETASSMLELFWEPSEGALFIAGSDTPSLAVRTKDLVDGATASTNATAAAALARLGALSGDNTMVEVSERLLQTLAVVGANSPRAVSGALLSFWANLAGRAEIVVVGDRPDLVSRVQRRFLPTSVLAWGEPYDSPLWEQREQGAAYVCSGYACKLPARDPGSLDAQLAELAGAAKAP